MKNKTMQEMRNKNEDYREIQERGKTTRGRLRRLARPSTGESALTTAQKQLIRHQLDIHGAAEKELEDEKR
jgi:hypothetical protein